MLMSDSSPQFGWNILSIREDTVRVLPLPDMLASLSVERHTLPGNVLGYGNAGTAKKAFNVVHAQMLEAGGWDAFERVRWQVRVWTSDRGTERHVADCPLPTGASAPAPNDQEERMRDLVARIRVGTAEAADQEGIGGFLYPRCLYMQGHLHTLYRPLQNSFEGLDAWKEHVHRLRGINAFLKSRGLRERFQETCLAGAPPHHRNALNAYTSVDVDEKWAWLSLLGRQLRVVWPILLRFWNLDRMTHGLEFGAIDVACLRTVDKAVAASVFPAMNELTLAVGRAVDRAAGALEGCSCHKTLWSGEGTYTKRRKRFERESGMVSCPWKGRGGCDMALGLKGRLIEDICTADSDDYQLALSVATTDARETVLLQEHALRARLREVYTQEWASWDHLPYSLLGLIGEDRGYSRPQVEALAVRVAAEFRQAWDGGSESRRKVHRVARLLLQPGSRLRSEFDAWYDRLTCFGGPGADLKEVAPAFYSEVLLYALAPLVERAIEAEHAKVKRQMRGREAKLPATFMAELRAPETDALLAQGEFRAWAAAQWYKPSTHRQVLAGVVPPAALRRMGLRQLVRKVYLFDRASQYRDMTAAATATAQWNALPDNRQRSEEIRSPVVRATVHLLKMHLQAAHVFSLPHAAFHANRADGPGRPDVAEPSLMDLTTAFAAALASHPDDVDAHGQTFFQVVNARPELRRTVRATHLLHRPGTVAVMAFDALGSGDVPAGSADRMKLRSQGEVVWLDLATLAGTTDWVASLLRWSAKMSPRPELLDTLDSDAARRLLPPPEGQGSSSSTSSSDSDSSSTSTSSSDEDSSASPAGSASRLAPVAGHRGARVVLETDAQGIVERLAALSAYTEMDKYVNPLVWPDTDHRALEVLVDVGVLSRRTTEFLDVEYALNMCATRWSCEFHASHGQLLVQAFLLDAGQSRESTKLELILLLLSTGWRPVLPGDAAPLTPGGERVFVAANMSKPRAYFECLAQSEVVFGRGVARIHHDRAAQYYLMLMSDGAQQADGAGMPAEWGAPGGDLPNLGDETDDEALGEGLAEGVPHVLPPEALACGPGLLPPVPIDVCPDTLQVAIGGGRVVTVRFTDKHASGEIRGYVTCDRPDHRPCHKYRQLNRAPSARHLAAWLAEWVRLGDTATRAEHIFRVEPTAAAVEARLATVR
jgi:hypothetical protein